MNISRIVKNDTTNGLERDACPWHKVNYTLPQKVARTKRKIRFSSKPALNQLLCKGGPCDYYDSPYKKVIC